MITASVTNNLKNTRSISFGIDNALAPKSQKLISSICQLSKARKLSSDAVKLVYEPNLIDSHLYFDVAILYGNQPIEILQEKISAAETTNTVVIIASDIRPTILDGSFHFIMEKRIGGSLLKTLDQIFENQIKLERRVLVVDDSQLVRTQMRMILSSLGIIAHFAEDGNSGILRAKTQKFSAIFLDVMLPGIDGYQICKVLRRDPLTSDTPVIMLTSKGSPFNRMRGALVGCDRYICKPVEEENIISAIEDLKINSKNTGI